MKSFSIAQRPRGLAASRSERGGHWRFPSFDKFACRWKQKLKVALTRNESYEPFILVFKPMLLYLATSVNKCLLISGFFFLFLEWNFTITCLEVLKLRLFITPILKSLVVPVIWLALIDAIYSQIAPFFAF